MTWIDFVIRLGIGFLGGDAILGEGSSVRRLAAVDTMIGSRLLLQAYFGALAVVGANLLLRPLVQQISGQSLGSTKSETRYRCRVVCHNSDEANVRALLLHPVRERKLVLHRLYSKSVVSKDANNQDLVEVKADFVFPGRNDVLLDQVVSLIKTKVKVSELSWEFVSQD